MVLKCAQIKFDSLNETPTITAKALFYKLRDFKSDIFMKNCTLIFFKHKIKLSLYYVTCENKRNEKSFLNHLQKL